MQVAYKLETWEKGNVENSLFEDNQQVHKQHNNLKSYSLEKKKEGGGKGDGEGREKAFALKCSLSFRCRRQDLFNCLWEATLLG